MAKHTKKVRMKPSELSFEVMGALAVKFGNTPLTIQRWAEKRDVRLTSDIAKEVLEEKNIELVLG
jgi:hypothetical protein